MEQHNAVDGLDELSEADFDLKEKPSHPLLRQVCEAIGWVVLLTGFVLAMTYLTPPQRSAEADLFDAECRAKGVAP